MYCDLLRHDDAGQHAAGQQLLRRRAAAAVPAKKGVRRDRDDVGLDLPRAADGGNRGCPCGQQVQPRHSLLAVKYLHAVQHQRLPAVQHSFNVVERVGLHRRVGGVQTVGGIGGGQVGGFGKAVRIGDEPGADAAARIRYGQGHAGQRRGLPGSRGIDQYTAF